MCWKFSDSPPVHEQVGCCALIDRWQPVSAVAPGQRKKRKSLRLKTLKSHKSHYRERVCRDMCAFLCFLDERCRVVFYSFLLAPSLRTLTSWYISAFSVTAQAIRLRCKFFTSLTPSLLLLLFLSLTPTLSFILSVSVSVALLSSRFLFLSSFLHLFPSTSNAN